MFPRRMGLHPSGHSASRGFSPRMREDHGNTPVVSATPPALRKQGVAWSNERGSRFAPGSLRRSGANVYRSGWKPWSFSPCRIRSVTVTPLRAAMACSCSRSPDVARKFSRVRRGP